MLTRRGIIATGGAALAVAAMPRSAGAQGRVYVNRIALVGSRVAVAASVKGQGPFLFMLDTGAPFGLIDEGVARRLKLARGKDHRVAGVGGRATLSGYIVRDMVLSSGLGLAEMRLSGIGEGRLGANIAGSLGSGVVTVFDSVLDFEHGEWRIHRDGPGDRTGFTRLESELSSEDPRTRTAAHITATVRIDGVPYRMTVDTGAPGEISLFSRAVRRSDLWNDRRPWSPLRSGGVGGETAIGRLIRAGKMELGGVTIERPLLYLRAPDGPVGEMSDGIIGLGALRHFDLATDVADKELWVRRNGLPLAPRRYNYSGLWIGGTGDAPVVEAVGQGSPAQAAGVLPGDRIQGIPRDLLIATLAAEPGATLPLTILRGGETIKTRLEFADFL